MSATSCSTATASTARRWSRRRPRSRSCGLTRALSVDRWGNLQIVQSVTRKRHPFTSCRRAAQRLSGRMSLAHCGSRSRILLRLQDCAGRRTFSDRPRPQRKPSMDMVTMTILEFDHGGDLPRDGHHPDEDVLLDDLQRGAGLHLRLRQRARRDDRGRRFLPGADRRHAAADQVARCASSPTETIEEGDVIVHNDPYRGGLHTPEHTFFKPIFVDGELMGYAVSIGHVSEIGGSVPGSFASEATEIFHEGLRVPPVKIKRRGEDNDDVWKLLLANVRTPRENYGDYRALISAVDLGERRLDEVIGKYGKETFLRAATTCSTIPKRACGPSSRPFPTATTTSRMCMEDDGIDDRPYTIAVTTHIQGDEVIVDFTGSDRQAAAPSTPRWASPGRPASTPSCTCTDPSIPNNSGCFRPIKVIAPPGQRGERRLPGAFGRRQHRDPSAHRLHRDRRAGAGAARPRLRHRRRRRTATSSSAASTAAAATTMSATTSCRPAGAVGPSPTATTRSTASTAIAAWCRPRCSRCATPSRRGDEPGARWRRAGPHRGGLGVTKRYRARDRITVSLMSDRHKLAPWGVDGGGRPARRAAYIQRQGHNTGSPPGGRPQALDQQVRRADAGGRRPHPADDRRRRRLRRPDTSATVPRSTRTSPRAGSRPRTPARAYDGWEV